MKEVYNLFLVIIFFMVVGLITNVSAVNLPESTGKLTVTRTIEDVHNPVTNTFSYTLTAYKDNPAIVSGVPVTFNISFNNTAPVIAAGEWYGTATETGILDLTGLNFTEPGDYYFDIIETKSSDGDNYPAGGYYTIVVSVRNVLDASGNPTGDLVADVSRIKTGIVKKQNIVFTKAVRSFFIKISNEVRGNDADLTKYFKILVDIDCPAGNIYQMKYSNPLDDASDAERTIDYNGSSINRAPNSGEFSDGTVYYYGTYTCGQTNYVYLKHGESVEIDDIMRNIEYSFAEQDAEKYDTYINGTSTNSKVSSVFNSSSGSIWDNANCPLVCDSAPVSNKLQKNPRLII